MTNEEFIFKICLVYIQHMKVCIEYGSGWNTDIFIHLLNKKEKNLVSVGKSIKIKEGEKIHIEHVVPRLILLTETRRLIRENKFPDNEIAILLQKHWKIAYITKDEQEELDLKSNLNLKQTMPKGWRFEDGDTLARLKLANIILIEE